MTLATTSTLGEITLAGDLTGSATSPAIKSSGVTPGTYTVPTVTINSKGQITSCASGDSASIAALIPVATTSQTGLVKIGAGINIAADGTISVPDIPFATSTTLGVARFGTGLAVSSGNVNLIPATASTLGGVKVGSGLNIDANGFLNVSSLQVATNSTVGVVSIGSGLNISNGGGLTAPVATSTTQGGVKIGSGVSVAADGTISVTATGAPASFTTAGVVKIGSGIDVAADGTISIPVATPTTPGRITLDASFVNGKVDTGSICSVGSGLTIDANGSITPIVASGSTAGVVKIGTGLNVDANGLVTLATASSTKLGGVKIGDSSTGVAISGGVISIHPSFVSTALRTDATNSMSGALVQGVYTSSATLGLSYTITPSNGATQIFNLTAAGSGTLSFNVVSTAISNGTSVNITLIVKASSAFTLSTFALTLDTVSQGTMFPTFWSSATLVAVSFQVGRSATGASYIVPI